MLLGKKVNRFGPILPSSSRRRGRHYFASFSFFHRLGNHVIIFLPAAAFLVGSVNMVGRLIRRVEKSHNLTMSQIFRAEEQQECYYDTFKVW